MCSAAWKVLVLVLGREQHKVHAQASFGKDEAQVPSPEILKKLKKN